MTIDEEKMYACWLDMLPWMDRRVKHTLLQAAGSPKQIYEMTDGRAEDILTALVGVKNYEKLKQHRMKVSPEETLDKINKSGIKYSFYKAMDFPQKLVNIPDPPFGIFYKGELPDPAVPAVAVIGARKCSEYGRYMAEHITDGLAQSGICIVSGMAMGIDGISQRMALKAGGKSYGVLGCGVDVIYPASNEPLYHRLLTNGGVISEYPPGTEPRAVLFPPRNRIISALSDVVLVVEAREKSGTFITVDMALEQGREVYAVPGRCNDSLSVGCNRLLRQGAGVALSAEDIIKDMGWKDILTKKADNKNIELSPIAREIYQVIDGAVMTQDDIVALLRERGNTAAFSQICQGLLELELKKSVVKAGGGYRRQPDSTAAI